MKKKFVLTVLAVVLFAAPVMAKPSFGAPVLKPGKKVELSNRFLVGKIPLSVKDQQFACYPRVKKLADGSFIMFYHGGRLGSRVFCTRSSDLKRWSEPDMILKPHKTQVGDAEDIRRYVNADAVVLPSGEIIAAVSFRATKGYKAGKGCGIVIIRSSDGGKSWSDIREIYEGPNWEPYLLLLPDGRLQCYFTDCDPVSRNSGTSVIVSSDNGLTWGSKARVCRQFKYQYDGDVAERTGENIYTDQMPCFRVLNDGNKIMGLLEGRLEEPAGIKGKSYFKLSAVYSDTLDWQDLGDDAAGPGKRFTNEITGCAGYLSVLPSGDVVASYNSHNVLYAKVLNKEGVPYEGENWQNGWVPVISGDSAYWGCSEIVDDHTVLFAMHVKEVGIVIRLVKVSYK